MIDLDRVVFDCPSFIYWIGNMVCNKTNIDNKLTYNLIDSDKASNYVNLLFFIKMSHAKNYTQVDNSVEILRKWNEQGFDISFVSSRPNFKSLQKATVEWLNQNNIKYTDLIFTCKNKPVFCKVNNFDVIIDDTYENCFGAQKLGITPVWIRTKYNANITDYPDDMFQTKSWTAIDDYVQSLYSEKYGSLTQQIAPDVDTVTPTQFYTELACDVDGM